MRVDREHGLPIDNARNIRGSENLPSMDEVTSTEHDTNVILPGERPLEKEIRLE